jgi:hypothetical protein
MSDQDLQEFHMLCQGLGGTEMPATASVEEGEIEEAENKSLDAEQLAQQRRHERTIKILELHAQGKSQAQIEREVLAFIYLTHKEGE